MTDSMIYDICLHVCVCVCAYVYIVRAMCIEKFDFRVIDKTKKQKTQKKFKNNQYPDKQEGSYYQIKKQKYIISIHRCMYKSYIGSENRDRV